MTAIPASGSFAQRDDWITPRWITEAVLSGVPTMSWDLAASRENTVCPFYFTEEDSFLDAELWRLGASEAWMNPPFSKAKDFFSRCFSEKVAFVGIYKASNLETQTWELILKNCDYLAIFKGRVPYVNPDTFETEPNVPFGSALIFFGIEKHRVVSIAKRLGCQLMKPVSLYSQFEMEML